MPESVIWECWTSQDGSFKKFKESEAEQLGFWLGEQLKEGILVPGFQIHIVAHDEKEYAF